MNLKIVVLAVAASHAFSVAQTVNVQPSRVLNLRAAIAAATGRDDFTIDGIAQSHGRWAAVGNFESTGESRLAAGDDSASIRVSDWIRPPADRVSMDADGLVRLRLLQSKHSAGEIEIRDHTTLRPIARYNVPESGLEPVVSGSELLWRRRGSLFEIHPSFVPVATLIYPHPPAPIPELAEEPL